MAYVPFDKAQSIQVAGVESLTPSDYRAIKGVTNSRIKSINILDPAVDLVWAKSNKRKVASSYFDYYFSGQDVKVFINGTEGETESDLAMMDFAFNIQQQKQPLYGYWNYVYSQMLRGTRIVTGQFRIATTRNDAMDHALSSVAGVRSAILAAGVLAPPSVDDQLIEQYWHQNIEVTPGSKGHNKFSAHPPFDFILVYGIQSVSIAESANQHNKELLDKYKADNLPLYTDMNERLVSADEEAMRFIIEGVELTTCQVEFSPDGTVCSEVYGFLARDMYIPS